MSVGNEGQGDFEETIDLNKAFETSVAVDVGHHPFAAMQEHPDNSKHKVLQGVSPHEVRMAEARRRYTSSSFSSSLRSPKRKYVVLLLRTWNWPSTSDFDVGFCEVLLPICWVSECSQPL